MGRKRDRKQKQQSQLGARYRFITSIIDEMLVSRVLLLKDQWMFPGIVWPLNVDGLLRVLEVSSTAKYAYRFSWKKCFNYVKSLKRVSKKLGWTFVETDQYIGLKLRSETYGYVSSLSTRISAMEQVLFLTFQSQLIMDAWNLKDGSEMKAPSYPRNENGENVLHILFSLPDHDKWLLDLITRILQTFGWMGMQDVSYIRMESPLHVAIRESHSFKALYDKLSVLKNQCENDQYEICNFFKAAE